MASQRAHWGSRLGFILAAAGSAVGLGNIWKFPYITGENGGGWFVLIYLICIAVVGLPIMMAEILIGRTAQNSPVGAFRALSRPRSPWIGAGWLGVAAAFVILSFYSVVAGWAMHYAWLSISDALAGQTPAQISDAFDAFKQQAGPSIAWHAAFMLITMGIVMGGVQKGLERWSRVLMPALLALMLILLVRSMSTSGFRPALDFVFGAHADRLTPGGVLEALGHAFFTLSLGMGAMITYGSYLRREEDLVTTSAVVAGLDTVIALMACLVLFPIIFTYGGDAAAGPGLLFQHMPVAFSQLPGGPVWAALFFLLVTFAALTSSISLLEVAGSYFIDERGWSRRKATLICGGIILVLGIPSAVSEAWDLFGARLEALTGHSWFGIFDYVSSNWMLPMGGLAIALFTAWRVGSDAREQAFKSGSRFGALYWGWVQLLRYVVPVGVVLVFLNALGFYDPPPETLWGWLLPPAVLLVFVVTGVLALRRGYNFLFWTLAGGPVGWAALALLPDVKTEAPPDVETRGRKRRGDFIGLGLSLLTIAAAAIWRWVLSP